mgnify:CR=1 FL=1
MKTRRYFGRSACIRALVLLTVGGLACNAAAAGTKTDVLSAIPRQSLFAVRVNAFEHTLGEVDKFAAGISPVPMGLRMLVRAQLAKVLGSPDLSGIDMNGTFGAFGVAGEADYTGAPPTVYIGVLVPISDFAGFVGGNPNVGEADENGIMPISQKGNGGKPWLIATRTGDHALVTIGQWYEPVTMYREMMGLQAGMPAYGESIASALPAGETEMSSSKPIWAYGDIQLAARTFRPFIEEKFGQIKHGMSEQMKNSPQGQMMDVGVIFDMYGRMLEQIADEAKSISLSVEPQADLLRVNKMLRAIPDTDLAAMLADDAGGRRNRLVGYTKDGAALNFAAMVGDSWKAFYDVALDLLADLAGENVEREDIARMKALTMEMVDTLGGAAAGSLTIDSNARPAFAMEYVVAVEDSAKFSRLLAESSELFNETGITDIYRMFGVEMEYTFKRGTGSYKGVTIDSARLSLKATEADSPGGQMIESMYGGGFDYRWAVVDGLCGVVVGADADKRIRTLIDQMRSGRLPAMGSEMKAALSLLPDARSADFFVTYNYVRFLKMVGAMTIQAGDQQVQMPEIDVPTSSSIAIAGWGGENAARFSVAVPKQHVMEIMAAFAQMQQKMMQRMGQEQPGQ